MLSGAISRNVSTGRIPSLDGLRAVSIVLVLLGHVAGTRFAYAFSVLRITGDLANLGVRIFFAISGFLITSLLLKEKSSTGDISLRNFYLRRILRIMPAFYFFLIVAAVLTRFHILAIPRGDFLYAGIYLANFHSFNWNLSHLWSLAVEEQFYLIWPVTLVLCGSKRSLGIALFMLSGWPLLRGIIALLHIPNPGPSINSDAVMAGCLLALLRDRLHRFEGYRRILESRWFELVPFALGLLNITYDHSHGVFFHFFGYLVTILIVLVIDRATTVRSRATAWLEWKPFVFVGTLSYSLYLWQQIFINRTGVHVFNYFPLNVIAAFFCASLSYFLIERPFLNLKNRIQTAR